MLTRIEVGNLKLFAHVEIELGNPVVFIGPNDSGKTTALQALSLWELGVRRWNEKHGGKIAPEKRPGVTINRKDIAAIPLATSKALWRNLAVREGWKNGSGKPQTRNILLTILVEGVTGGIHWKCGLEFDYANVESIYCRPMRLPGSDGKERMPIPVEATNTQVAYLPPMSGLAAEETRLPPGRITVLIGEGRTAEVLRNLCYRIAVESTDSVAWENIVDKMDDLFGIQLLTPSFIQERGEITMSYRTQEGTELDIASSGRGLQQTLLLLAYLSSNAGSVLLLDEPDAHLEILRQRQIYQTLSATALRTGSQLIAASHSEVVLNEAADRDVVVAFLGQPHRIDDRGSQLLKALKEIGFEQYYLAEQTGWVLYLEGSSDLAVLRTFAELLEHPAADVLQRPFVHYVLNQPGSAYSHFFGLREAKKDLVGYALFDRLEHELEDKPRLVQKMWKKREIENYFCSKSALVGWAQSEAQGELPLLSADWKEEMEQAIEELEAAVATLGKGSPWGSDLKVSDEFLAPLLQNFYARIKLPVLTGKANFHQIARFCDPREIDDEVRQVLDGIVEISELATAIV